MTENEPVEGAIVTTHHRANDNDMVSLVREAVSNPQIDVGKMEVLLRMQRDIEGESARVQFIEAMNEAQAEVGPVARDAENKQTSTFYAKLESVDAAIRPVYTRHGFSLSFDEEQGDGTNMTIVCEVSHVRGHSKKYRLFAPPDVMGPKGTPTKTALHGRGSTITFLRRYLTCNIFNIVMKNQDDDGVRGGKVFLISQEIREMEDLIMVTRTDERQFLSVMCNTAQSLGEIERVDFARLKNSLLSKRAKMTIAKGDAA